MVNGVVIVAALKFLVEDLQFGRHFPDGGIVHVLKLHVPLQLTDHFVILKKVLYVDTDFSGFHGVPPFPREIPSAFIVPQICLLVKNGDGFLPISPQFRPAPTEKP
jgi:hypothetical protein